MLHISLPPQKLAPVPNADPLLESSLSSLLSQLALTCTEERSYRWLCQIFRLSVQCPSVCSPELMSKCVRNMLAIFPGINLLKLDKFCTELTSCRSLAQLTFPFSRRAIASQRCLSLQPTWKYTWSHYLWQDNRGLLLKKSTGNIGVKVVSIITSPSTPVFDVMLMILFHKTDPKPYLQIILMMSKLLGLWVQHLFITLVTCCN